LDRSVSGRLPYRIRRKHYGASRDCPIVADQKDDEIITRIKSGNAALNPPDAFASSAWSDTNGSHEELRVIIGGHHVALSDALSALKLGASALKPRLRSRSHVARTRI
jgi:hypothetical protein